MSSAEAVRQLWPNVQPRHNQRLGKSISSSCEPVVCKCCVGVVYDLVCELVGSRRIRL